MMLGLTGSFTLVVCIPPTKMNIPVETSFISYVMYTAYQNANKIKSCRGRGINNRGLS